jgi:hypothetical protein
MAVKSTSNGQRFKGITLGSCDDQQCQKEPAWNIPQNQGYVPPELS